MPTLRIFTAPIGSQLTSAIGVDEDAGKNDFRIFITSYDGNFTLERSDVSLTMGYSIVSFEGKGCTYEAIIRPPTTAGVLTVSIARNAVLEGNAAVSQTIRVSTQFPDADAESYTRSFNHGLSSGPKGIAVTPTRLRILQGTTLYSFHHNGSRVALEDTPFGGINVGETDAIDIINEDLLISFYRSVGRYRLPSFSRIQSYTFSYALSTNAVTHTQDGILYMNGNGVHLHPYSAGASPIELEFELPRTYELAYNDGLIFNRPYIYKIEANAAVLVGNMNVESLSRYGNYPKVSIYQDTLYAATQTEVYTLDIKKYRPIAKNTKTTIYPVFASAGDTIPLTQFSPDAERIIFDVGYNKPPFLSINSNNALVTTSAAETCVVRLKAINRFDATETGTFYFYLVFEDETPVWRDTDFDLTMRAGSSYNLWDLVENADSIAFKSGGSRPSGSSLSDGIFTIGTVGGSVEFTATRGSSTADITIRINIHQDQRDLPMDNFRYRVKIGGIDVSDDLIESPTVAEDLDPILLNEDRVNEATVILKNIDGKYSSDVADNFWVENQLKLEGFKERIHIYVDHYNQSTQNWVERLLFSGLILESQDRIESARLHITCVDESFDLRNTLISGTFGNPLQKYDRLRKQSEQETYEGVYESEASLVPMVEDSGVARSDRTDMAIRKLPIRSEGPPAQDTGYLTASTFHTAGGFLDENPLLRFKTAYRSEEVRFLINQLAIHKNIYNTEIDIPERETEDPFLLNRGSIARSVEKTRTTRLPVDWVHDSTNNRILTLLSNPESHIADLLVQYDMEWDSFRTLYRFAKNINVHRIARRDATNYYILTSDSISQDRSALTLPRQSDKTGYAYDAVAEGSRIRIFHYNATTNALTEHVDEDDNFPPQLGIHFYVGFENTLYVDDFEGIRPEYRDALKWQGSHLYYPYAKDGEFGVARVNASGTTERLMRQTRLGTWNHLNFAFDVLSNETVYLVDCWKINETVTVVDRSLPNGASQSLTLSNDLSGVAAPQQLFIQVTVSRTDLRGDTRGTITGVDENGNTVSENYGQAGRGNGAYSGVSEHIYQQITSVTGGGSHAGANVKITNIAGDITTLEIRRRTAAGVETTLFSQALLLKDTTKIPTVESTVIGVHEAIFHNNFLYFLAIVATLKDNNGTRYIEKTKSAGMRLYRCNVTEASLTLTVVDQWDFVSRSACNLTIHNGAVHYTEHPLGVESFKPINPDLDDYDEDMGYNVLPESIGALKKVTAAGSVESLGNVWYEARPFNIAQTCLLSIGDDLHLLAGYGNGDEVLRYDSLASGADNAAHLVYGKTLHYVLPRFSPGGSVWAALSDLAKNVNATLSFQNGLICITDRAPYRAETDGATGTGAGNLRFSDANKAFPSSGYLKIGNEVLRFTGRSGTAFTGITRGVLETSITNHADESGILYLDNIIEDSSILGFSTRPDTNRIYNHIRTSGQIAEVRDEASIATHGERSYSLDLSHLTQHEEAWIDSILQVYLENFKDPKKIVNLRIKPDFNQKLGDRIAFLYDDELAVMQILSVEYRRASTSIQGRTV